MIIQVLYVEAVIAGVGAGDTQIDGVINQTADHPVTGLGFDPVDINPNNWQTLIALLRLRILRMFRDIQKLYFMIILPLGFAALGLYVHSIQTTDPKMKSMVLNAGDPYFCMLSSIRCTFVTLLDCSVIYPTHCVLLMTN